MNNLESPYEAEGREIEKKQEKARESKQPKLPKIVMNIAGTPFFMKKRNMQW